MKFCAYKAMLLSRWEQQCYVLKTWPKPVKRGRPLKEKK